MNGSQLPHLLSYALSPDADPLPVAKLARHGQFSAKDRHALSRALSLDIRSVRVRTSVNDAPGRPRKLKLLLSGWACCYRRLPDGRNHLVACYLPGDVCDLHSLAAPRPDTFIVLLAGARVASLSVDALNALHRDHPATTLALWLDTQIASSIEREWLVNVATRSARERIAHLLSEFAWRSEAADGLRNGSYKMPLTQAEFAGACGLTPSHVNRALRVLHDDGLVTWSNAVVTLGDRVALAEVGGFTPAYMQPIAADHRRAPQMGLPMNDYGAGPTPLNGS